MQIGRQQEARDVRGRDEFGVHGDWRAAVEGFSEGFGEKLPTLARILDALEIHAEGTELFAELHLAKSDLEKLQDRLRAGAKAATPSGLAVGPGGTVGTAVGPGPSSSPPPPPARVS